MIAEELARGAARLAAAGIETPRLDAELLLSAALDVTRTELILGARRELPAPARRRYEELLDRRREREPVAYLVGRRWFRRLELEVDSRVLIPRPETELLVQAALTLPEGSRVADVGTGSGAIALALADERSDLRICGLDISPEALEVARANARRLGLAVEFRRSDLLDDGEYDAVVANLPYVAEGATLAPESARHEPPAALYGGPDGLAAIRRLAGQLAERPAVRWAALEIGCEQGPAVARIMRSSGFAEVERRRDLAGLARIVVGRR
jgi:release factor glutamine methyltransferase